MDELTQILSHEEKNRDIIEKERGKVAQELQDKENKIVKMLETEHGLTAEEKMGILTEEGREFKKIEEDKKKELDSKMLKLNKNREGKIESAVNFIIENSFKE
ncbi:hypothetical protein KKC65_02465 [Patescibacteria group bacterium]|nr:hypothetical protein [Patescibacteria group bacterium]